VKRAILLQTLATKSKNKALNDFLNESLDITNGLLLAKSRISRFNEFHRLVYSVVKQNTSFNSQIICDIERQIWRKKTDKVNGLTVKFNIPRNCKTFETKANFFVELGLYPRNRIAIPIKQNRNYQRFQDLIKSGWVCKTFGLTTDLQIVAYLSKEKEIPQRKNIMGIDANAKYFALSIISPDGKVLYQTYLGKQIWIKRRKIIERRALLQSLNAKKKLERIKNYERNFVKTNLGQIVKEIIKLAIKYNANIAIEKLQKFKPKGRRFNRTVMRIPFYKFKQILEQRCFDYNIKLNIVDSWHTSKWCSHCGALANGHSSNYSLFKCKCGQVVNSDRKASLAIAVKSLLERGDSLNQKILRLSSKRVPVNELLRPNAVGSFAVRHNYQLMESPRL
jgi:IS605 OrfB family transposase